MSIKNIFLFAASIFVVILFVLINNQTLYWRPFLLDSSTYTIYKSNCSCHTDIIEVEETITDIYKVYIIKDGSKNLMYNISKKEYNESIFTCNMYSSLRRGKRQKVISYTLFGTNKFYYDKIRDVSKQIQKFYPDWTMRVYHDSSINRSVVCDIECQTDDNGNLIDNADFCDLTDFIAMSNGKIVRPVEYVLPRMWRFLAVGDSFIDMVMSRDTDSYILQREVDSVNVWLNSDKLFHIMRDHPQHSVQILAGMWGFKVSRNLKLAQRFYNLSINSSVIKVIDPMKLMPKRNISFSMSF